MGVRDGGGGEEGGGREGEGRERGGMGMRDGDEGWG